MELQKWLVKLTTKTGTEWSFKWEDGLYFLVPLKPLKGKMTKAHFWDSKEDAEHFVKEFFTNTQFIEVFQNAKLEIVPATVISE